MKKIFRRIFIVLSAVLFTLGVFVFFAARWLMKTWANLTMDELMYHMGANLEGTNPDIIKNALLMYGLPILIVSAVFIVGLVLLRKKKNFQTILAISGIVVSIVAVIATFVKLNSKLAITEYIEQNRQTSEFIEENYIAPQDVELTFPEQRRNLIYIYLESMETTYTDVEHGGAFEQDVIPELTQLALENEDFSGSEDILNGGIALSGGTYTMGALFSQSSGLPLRTGISMNDMDTQTEFFPTIDTLGDILEDNGYVNELMIGSRATFGGRALYFETHGNYSIFDFEYAVQRGLIPESYYRWWGFEDRKLFTYARSELIRLADSDQPFNLTLLTVDTHFEDGYVCDICDSTFGDDQYSNVFACSSSQVADFVSWVQQQDFYENTTIVICGDHPTMDSDYCVNVDDDYSRRVYTCVINSAVEPEDPDMVRTYSTLDLFPTTLASLGVGIEGDRLGLGTNLFSSEQTLIEEYGEDYVRSQISMKSPFLSSLNDVDITEGFIDRVTDRSALAMEYEENGDECGLMVYVDTYTQLTAGILVDHLEVDVSYEGGDTQTIPLEGFQSDGNVYYNEDIIDVPAHTEVYVSLYLVGTDEVRYLVGECSSSSDLPIPLEPTETS